MKRTAALLVGFLVLVLLGASPASAADWKPFSADALAQAQQDGKPILVDIAADWCPTCRAQAPILKQLTGDPKFKDMVVLKMDFDSQKADVRALRASQQSTLIVYKGATETGRSIGDTNPQSIEALLDKAL
jgi:thioredoxin 1